MKVIADALPLAGNTGATSLQAVTDPAWHIDWLAVTVHGPELVKVAELVSEAFHPGKVVGLGSWSSMGGARFYGKRYEYLGATILAEPQAPGAEDNMHVVIPGDPCTDIGVDQLLRLLVRLRLWSSRSPVARIDVAVDGVPFKPLDAYEAVLRGQTVSWVKRGADNAVSHHWQRSNRGKPGDTLSIGSRQSHRYMRIYDWRGPTRIELETKEKYADALAVGLINRAGDERALAEFVVACLREFCDFGEQDGVHGARGVELLPWWAEFVGSVDRIGKLVTDRRERLSVDRALRWVDRAVVPSLAMIAACYGKTGRELLGAWIEGGQPRLSPAHLQAIAEFRHVYERTAFTPGHLDGQEDAA